MLWVLNSLSFSFSRNGVENSFRVPKRHTSILPAASLSQLKVPSDYVVASDTTLPNGLRLIVKRVAPGKIFDRSADLQVLQLGLGSKPINSDDFYGYSGSSGPAPAVDKNLPDRVALRIFR